MAELERDFSYKPSADRMQEYTDVMQVMIVEVTAEPPL